MSAAPVPHSRTQGGHPPGSIRAALSYRDFRIFYFGTALSAVGTWMQNFTLPTYIDARTNSATLVGLLVLAQLGPLMVLAIPAGVIADRTDRRKLMLAMQATMLVWSLVLAALVWRHAPLWTLFAVQLIIGIANTLNAPALSAAMPMLVDRADLPGAISLNSAMINGSRIGGPALAALLAAAGMGVSGLLIVNAATFLFLIVPLVMLRLPTTAAASKGRQGMRVLMTGLGIARRRAVLARTLVTMTLFSVVCLPFVGLFPSVARLSWGLDAAGGTFKALYIVWGIGAFAGALAVGTIFRTIDLRKLIPRGLVAFAGATAVFALVPSVGWAFPTGFLLGFVYFVIATAMSSLFQQNLADHERASTMSLWFMSFGGSVPIGNVIAGPMMDRWGPEPVLLVGAAFALVLAATVGLRRLQPGDFLSPDEGGIEFRPAETTRIL